jgi:hypothetical protein
LRRSLRIVNLVFGPRRQCIIPKWQETNRSQTLHNGKSKPELWVNLHNLSIKNVHKDNVLPSPFDCGEQKAFDFSFMAQRLGFLGFTSSRRMKTEFGEKSYKSWKFQGVGTD